MKKLPKKIWLNHYDISHPGKFSAAQFLTERAPHFDEFANLKVVWHNPGTAIPELYRQVIYVGRFDNGKPLSMCETPYSQVQAKIASGYQWAYLDDLLPWEASHSR